MYSSKYVQANTGNSFKQAKDDVDIGKTVLFSGTPCQIAGLKAYLRKDYANLITVDLVCHGVPSPLALEKYKQEFLNRAYSPLLIHQTLLRFLKRCQGYH